MEHMTNRQMQSLNTKKKIEEAANRCFVRKGMACTLISDIVQEAGVSVGTFYHHFKNKDDLIVSLFTRFDFDFVNHAQELLSCSDAMEGLLRMAGYFSRDAYDTQNQVRQMLTLEYLRARSSLTIEELWPKNRPYFLILCTIIARGQYAGEIRRDMPPQEIAELVMVCTRGYNIDWAGTNGAYPLQARMEKHMPVLFDGLRYTPERDGAHCGVGYCLPAQRIPESYEEQAAQLRAICQKEIDQLGHAQA